MISFKNKYMHQYIKNNYKFEKNSIDLTCPRCTFFNEKFSENCSNCDQKLNLLNDDIGYNLCDNVNKNIDFLNEKEIIDYLSSNNKNIFLSSDIINIDNNYEYYDYFFGFGNSIYNFLDDNFAFDVSKVFDGFIRDQTIEDSFPNTNFDILFIFPYNHVGNSIQNRTLLPILELVNLFKLFGKNITLAINAKKEDVSFESINMESKSNKFSNLLEIYNNIIFLEENMIPIKYLETSKSLVFANFLDSRLFYADFIKEKSFIFSVTDQLVCKFLDDKYAKSNYSTYSYLGSWIANKFSEEKDYHKYIETLFLRYFNNDMIINNMDIYNWKSNIIERFYNLFSNKQECKIPDVSLKFNECINQFNLLL